MKQSTFSAVMANSIKNLLQGYTKGIRFVAIFTILFTIGVGNMWADYTITFKSNTKNEDGSTAQTSIANLISSGGDNVSTISAAKAYNGKSGYGVKLGSSSDVGYVTMNLVSAAQIKASKLVVSAACYDSGKTLMVTITYTDNTTTTKTLTPASTITAYDVELTATKTIKIIKIESVTKSKGRMYCSSIKVVAPTWKIKGSWDGWTEHAMTVNGTEATCSLSLSANKRYEFGFDDNGVFYKNNGVIIVPISGWVFNTSDGNCKLHTGPAGEYTFKINTSNKQVTVIYPEVTHPHQNYVYFKNSDVWGTVKGYLGNTGNSNKASEWPGIDMPTTIICDETYHYGALSDCEGLYNVIIFNNGHSGYGNQTSDLTVSGSGGKYNANRDANWHDFTTYTITFSGNGNTGGLMSNVTGIPCDGSTTLVTNGYTRTGYTFNNWKTNVAVTANSSPVDANGTVANEATLSNITSNITLTAQWKANTYTITYKDGGNTNFSGTHESGYPTTHTYGTATTLKNATKTGYIFEGWYKESTCTNKVTSLGANAYTANITLYAKWTPITYYVQFNGNGSTGGSMSNQTFKYGTAQNLTPNAFTRTGGYTFAGWNTKEDGSGTNYADKASVNNLSTTNGAIVNLYAKWTKVHTITWKVNGQQYGEKQEVEDGQTIGSLPDAPDAPASCSGKVFMGWTESATVDSDGTGITYISASTKPNSDKTYHAVFATETSEETTTTISKTKIEDFEKQTNSNEYNTTKTYTAANSNAGIAWKMYYGTVSTNAVLNGSKSAQMRWYSSASANLPYVQTTAIVKGLKSISFKTLTSDNDYKYSVSYSTNNSTWTNVATSQSVGSTSSTQTKSYTINANGVDAYIKIAITSTSNVTDKATFRIDDVVFTYLESTTTTETKHSDYVTSCTPQYTITLDLDGGVFDETPDGWTKVDENTYTQVVNENTTITLPTPTKKGYTYKGWRKNNTGNPVSSITASETATYTASYDCAIRYVAVEGTYALVSGQKFELTAIAQDENHTPLECPDDATYTWQRKDAGGNWVDVTGNESTDKTKLIFNSCEVAHCGTYRCHITYGDCGAYSNPQTGDDGYRVHVFHLKGNFENNWNKEYTFTATANVGIATLSIDLVSGHTHEFKIYDGIYEYGNSGIISASVTDWPYGSDNNSNTILQTGADGTYVFTLDFTQLIDNSTNVLFLDVTYPPSNQSEGYTVYYDNFVHNWQNVYYRIGHNRDNGDGTWGWNQNQKMTKVPGTSHLYTTKTPQFDNFEAWHIANNVSWADKNSIYLVNPDGTEYDITHASVFKKFVVVEDITLTPEATGTFVNDENCTYYADVKQSGMKMHKATVIPATGGTITVSYTDHDGTDKSDFTSGDRDLAHTCLLTITATPDAGYSLGTLTVNNVPFTSGNVHTLAEDAVIKVVWNTNQYTVSFDGNGADGGSTASVSGNYLTTVTLTPNGFTRTGYTFSGWNTKSDGTGTPYADCATFNILPQDVILYAQWEKAYIVEFSHNDKGIFNGEEIVYVPTNDNIITLPTVEDVSCGFYDTFEGWIVSNDEYVESTTKPATVYAGGASYRVTGDCTFRALYSKCEGDNKEVYVKVIENLDDWSGTYLIVNETNNVVMDGSKTTETGLIAQNNCQNITINNNQIESNNQNDTYTFTIAPHTTTIGKYSIKSYSGYYIGSNSASNTINATTIESTYSNSITITDGILTIGCGKYKDSDASKEYRLMYMHSGSGAPVFKYYPNTQGQVCLYKKGTLCTKYYSTNPSCEKPVGVHIVYNANAVDASMSCTEQNRTYKVENEVNKYPQLASQLQFCTNATREGYTLVGWNTQANGQGTTYNINQNYYNLPVSGELDGEKWITLNLYAMWKTCIKFNLGNATGGTGIPDAVVENGECILPTPTAEQLGTIPCGYEFYAWSETSVNATQTKPVLFMSGDTYTGSALTLYAVYRWCEGNTGSDTYYFTFIVDGKTYCITQKHNNYDRFVVAEATTGLVFGLENDYLYYLDENGTKNYVYYGGSSTTVTTTTTYPNADTQKTTFVEGDNGTTIVEPAINNGNRTLQFTGTGNISDYYDRAYYTTGGTNPTLVEVQSSTCTYATNPTCYTNTNLHFVTNGGTLNYPTNYDETDYQELAPGSTVFLPTATFAGEWTFEGWKRGAPLESTTTKPYDPSFYPVTLNSTQFEVDDLGDIYFYAVYSKTNDDKQFDPVNGGTYKLFAIGADDTKTYMPIWSGGRGTPSGVTTCAETGDYTITPGTGTHAGQYQITCGEYTLGVVSGNTDLNEVEGTWWNIEPSTSGKGTWRITVVGSTDDRALICSFSTAKSFGNYAISNLNGSAQTVYRDMEIGECIYTEYTSTPENIPYITITGAPVKITSTNGERVYASTTVHIEAHNFTGERIIHLSATNGFGVDPVQVRTNGQGAYSGNVKVYYEPTTDGDGQTINSSVLTASQTGGTNAEKISQTFAAIQGRNMPANFVIAAKWDGHWYALPANCTSSLSSTEGLLIEVNDVENPTMATSAPASAKYGLREVIPSRQTDYGQGIVFTERFAEGDKQFALYNGSNANIQVNAQYTNYAQTNPDKYEWIPSTSDFNEYTLTNASTGRNLGLTSGTFGAYTAASNQVRLLPATFYEPATAQVLKWKANSVIVMYTGAEATATTQVGDNAQSTEQILADQKLTHGIYELTTDQALTSNAGGALSLYFGVNTRVELEIPLIISGEITASANAHDVVILENSKLTAAATKYSYKDVYVYGGAKLAIPTGTTLGVNNIILRAGSVATDGAGQNATYQYIYPQVELKGTLTSSVQNIRYEYVTDYDHWYHLVLPFDGSLTSIHYPTEYYGDQVKLDNTGSWQIKRYDGATRATGNYDAWKDIEKDEPKATIVTAGKGYIFWGAPKKITANDEYDRPTWGIQRITMLSDVSETISKAKDAENADKTISGLGSYKNVTNNSGADNDQGWNLIGNPYMVNLTGLNSQSLQIGQLIHETDASGNWTGKWQWDDTSEQTGLRYVTIPSDHFETYEAKPMTWFTEGNPMIAGRSFFVQIAGDATDLVFDVTKKAALVPALLAENSDKPVDIETGIILRNETLQDEVNFWIKDGKTNDYEYNADYPKTPNNNQFNIYGVHTNGDLSWVATGPEYAAESMPIGYQVPVAGTYMLSLSEIYNSDGLDALYVTDHALSPEVTMDIMSEPYEFSVNQAETNNERFTVSVRVKAKTENGATGLDNVGADGEQIHKFIYQDKMYILHHGVIYDATGKRVITINK